MTFEFVENLPHSLLGGGRNAMHIEFAAALKARPSEWAIFPEIFTAKTQVYSRASNIKQGKYSSFPKGNFDAAVRGMQVFVRYTGG